MCPVNNKASLLRDGKCAPVNKRFVCYFVDLTDERLQGSPRSDQAMHSLSVGILLLCIIHTFYNNIKNK